MKNIKRMFFVLTLITLLATVGAVCAADDANGTAAVDSSVNDVSTVSDGSSDTVAAEPATTTSNDNKVDTKTIEKTDKNLKKSTRTVEVNNYDELTATIRNALNDSDNNEYIINLNEGVYYLNNNINFNEISPIEKNIIINCNNQILSAQQTWNYIQFYNTATSVSINNATINHQLNVYNITLILNNAILNQSITTGNNAEVTLKNSTVNNTVFNNDKIIISDDCIFGENFSIQGNGEIIINDTDKILPYQSFYNGTYTIENVTFNGYKNNYGNLTTINSIINGITNYGHLSLVNTTINGSINNLDDSVLIISDDCIFGENFSIQGNGEIIINDTDRLIPYLMSYNGNYTIENQFINLIKINYGNLTLHNCTITESFENQGNMTIIDCVISGGLGNSGNITIINTTNTGSLSNNGNTIINNSTLNCMIINNGLLIIDDDTNFGENTNIQNTRGEVIINDTTRILPYITILRGNNSFKNVVVNKMITNYGNLTIVNSTLNSRINNAGTLIIDDETVFGDNFQLNGDGEVIINNTNRIIQYMQTFNGNYTFNNITLEGFRTNNGIVTIANSTINSILANNNELYIINSIINSEINNMGLLFISNSTLNSSIWTSDDVIITDDCIFGENLEINGEGEIIYNDTEKILPYMTTYNGNYTFKNMTLTGSKVNLGNITFVNSTLNGYLENYGILIISDDCILGEELNIEGEGTIIINDTNKLTPYLSTYNGNYTLENMTITTAKSNYGNLTLNNCTILSPITNGETGNIFINNCTVNVEPFFPGFPSYWLYNYANTTIREDTTIINGQIMNMGAGKINYSELPKPKTYIVTNNTLHEYFQDNSDGNLTEIVNPGDTLDFQGNISANHSLTINKPINVISTTQDAYVDLDTHAGSLLGDNPGTCFVINNGGSYTNVTGIYFHNTQLWIYNTHYVTLDNISAVVENQAVGSGVGQTSIRANSSHVTLKNSFIYTENNGGSSSVVLAWADNCTIENNTIQGVGMVGNLIYSTFWNVEIPDGIEYNNYNKIINNTVIGPAQESGICWAIAVGGKGDIIDGNTINYTGVGITSTINGFTGIENSSITEHICNNKLYGGCGIDSNQYIYNNYIEQGKLLIENAIVINNTVYDMRAIDSIIENNNISNILTIDNNDKTSKSIIENNSINTIAISRSTSNIIITNNNITGQININGTDCNITNNKIITENEYTITGRGKNNTITDNYLVSANKIGDKSISLDNTTNTIANNTPYETTIKVDTTTFTAGQNATINANIYYGNNINTNITNGKVTFKVNGKTLKDTNGKVIYAKVVNGTATIENYVVPDDWAKDGTTIQAVYSGSTQCEKLTSEKTEITVTPEELTLTTTATHTAPGQTTTLTATLSDNSINTGKIVFKINGKTVKDADGKVIYAKVTNGTVSVDYTLPETYKAGNYTVTATFIASGYDRLVANTTMTVEN